MKLSAYLEQREALVRDAVPGIEPARRLARLTDEMLVGLAEEAGRRIEGRSRWSLVALGGYGSGALLPASDLDLLILTDGPADELKPFTEAFLYPLWDAGLKVGHQVRTARDQLRAIREDLATLAATLTGRTIAGDEDLARRTLDACIRDAHKRSREVRRQLRERERPGSAYLLEPDLKEGAGGRRDYDELVWTAAILTGTRCVDPSPLVGLGMLTASQADAVIAAAAVVTEARWALHASGAGNLMTLEAADDMGPLADRTQAAIADTALALQTVRRRVSPGDAAAPASEPSAAEVFTLAGEGELGLERLEELARSGLLDALIPGMRELMTLRRPGLAHTLTVGAHCLKTAVVARSLGSTLDAGPAAALSSLTVDRPDVLTAAALVHDVGKRQPGQGHAERGIEPAREVATRLGLSPVECDDVARLVEHHLLLAETATRVDLDDEDAILRVAGTLADPNLLGALHVLTVADSIATGPGAWNEWTAALIGKLVTRLETALSPNVDGAGIAFAAERTRRAALAAAPEAAERERAFVNDAPLRYLANHEVHHVLEHAALVAHLATDHAPGAHAVGVAPGPLFGTYRVSVAARDRHGLLALLAGSLALAGLDILAVEALVTRSGVALDTFTVGSATLAPADSDTWARLDRLLDAALRDRLAIGVRLAERRRHYRAGTTGVDQVDILPNDPYAASVRIRAADRVGLLYDIARAMAESGLEIVSMTATTRDERADDVFRVIDANGEVPEEGVLGMLKMRLRELG